MHKKASASDRHQAVVKGQEGLTGVKEVRVKRTLTKNSEDEYVVKQSTRTDMVYDTIDSAKDAYDNIIDAKEEAEFEEGEEGNMDDKQASFKSNSKIGNYVIKVIDPIKKQAYLVNKNKEAGWFSLGLLRIAQKFPNDMRVSLKENKLVPIDLGNVEPTNVVSKDPVDVGPAGAGGGQAGAFTQENGKTTDRTLVPKPDTDFAFTHAAGEVASLLQPDFAVTQMEDELKTGVNRELEHVNDPAKATEIAIDHLAEDPQYYTKLNSILPEEGPEHKRERIVDIQDTTKPENKDVPDLGEMIDTSIEDVITEAESHAGISRVAIDTVFGRSRVEEIIEAIDVIEQEDSEEMEDIRNAAKNAGKPNMFFRFAVMRHMPPAWQQDMTHTVEDEGWERIFQRVIGA
jgi:hypothetical protein